MTDSRKILEATTQVVSAYVAGNKVELSLLPGLIRSVSETLSVIEGEDMVANALGGAGGAVFDRSFMVERVRQEPVVSIEESVTDDYLICLEDGKKLKMLKRHLRAVYDMTPEDYRRKWGLPDDYPMVAPNYAKVRSKLARQGGFGTNIQPNKEAHR